MIAIARKYEPKYEFTMERITISLDKKLLAEVKAIAGPRGVSKFMAEAAQEKLGRSEWKQFLAERAAKYGKPSKKLTAAIDRDMRKIFGL
jgi:hypothetical protein